MDEISSPQSQSSDDESPSIPDWLSLPNDVLEMVLLQLDWPSTIKCRRVCKDWNEFIKGLKIETKIERNWFNSSPTLYQEYIRLEFRNNPSDTNEAGILHIGKDIIVIIRHVEVDAGQRIKMSQIQVTDESYHDTDSKTWTIDVSVRGVSSFAKVRYVEVTDTLIMLR